MRLRYSTNLLILSEPLCCYIDVPLRHTVTSLENDAGVTVHQKVTYFRSQPEALERTNASGQQRRG